MRGYITTVIDDNRFAKRMLTSRRGGLPTYEDWGRIVTCAIPLKQRPQRRENDGRLVSGEFFDLRDIVEFINRAGARRQFASVWEKEGFGSGLTRGLSTGSFRVLLEQGRMAAVAALWDQRAFRQTAVTAYRGAVGLLRPVFNGLLRAAGYRGLPPPGEDLNAVYVSLVAGADDRPGRLTALLNRVIGDAAAAGYAYAITGFHERDPLVSSLRTMWGIRYVSRLYCVFWDDAKQWVADLDRDRIPHVEVATL